MKTLLGLLLSGLICSNAFGAELGILRAIADDASVLTIDEGRYRPSATLKVNNLAQGLNELSSARVGQPVRFTLDKQGQLEEIWLYPLHADERKQLGINLGDERQ